MLNSETPKIYKHSEKSEKSSRINSMIKMADNECKSISAGELDRNPFLLNCPNGTIDLKKGKLRPYRRTDFMTQMIPVNTFL